VIGAWVGRAVTPKLIGGLLLAWAASIALLWAFMAGQARGEAESACAAVRAAAADAATAALVRAVAEARSEWEAAQAAADEQAAIDRAAAAAELRRARMRAESLSRQLLAHIHAKPLPADCRLDAERLRLYAESRRGAAAAAPRD